MTEPTFPPKLGKDLIENYPATVYGMAISKSPSNPSYKVTSLRVKSVTKKGLDISLVTCKGDFCEMKSAFYEFRPALQSASDLAKGSHRLERIHNQVLSPKLYWLFTDPLAFLILVTCSSLAYGSLVMGIDGMVDSISKAERLESGIASIFGSTRNFSLAVMGSFWFSVIAHGIEACMAIRYCVLSLKLGMVPTIKWAFLVFCVGYPIFSKIQALIAVQEAYSSKSK